MEMLPAQGIAACPGGKKEGRTEREPLLISLIMPFMTAYTVLMHAAAAVNSAGVCCIHWSSLESDLEIHGECIRPCMLIDVCGLCDACCGRGIQLANPIGSLILS